MDTFVCSSWYFARFLSPTLATAPLDQALCQSWLPVDLYVGGPEHAVMHLLYFRFFTRVMQQMGLVSCQEPVRRLLTQGMVNAPAFRCRRHGYQPASAFAEWSAGQPAPACPQCDEPLSVAIEKMSKSKYNGIDPMALIERYGADTARLYVLFAAPPEKDMEWSTQGVEGQYRFVSRVRRLGEALGPLVRDAKLPVSDSLSQAEASVRRLLHDTIAKVQEEFDTRNHFNTAIAALMELTNALYAAGWHERAPGSAALGKEALLALAKMLSPLAPHTAESLFAEAGGVGLCAQAGWPAVDESARVVSQIPLAVQVQGKLRAQIFVAPDASRQAIVAAARADDKVAKWLEGVVVLKEVVVPGRLVNFVVRPA